MSCVVLQNQVRLSSVLLYKWPLQASGYKGPACDVLSRKYGELLLSIQETCDYNPSSHFIQDKNKRTVIQKVNTNILFQEQTSLGHDCGPGLRYWTLDQIFQSLFGVSRWKRAGPLMFVYMTPVSTWWETKSHNFLSNFNQIHVNYTLQLYIPELLKPIISLTNSFVFHWFLKFLMNHILRLVARACCSFCENSSPGSNLYFKNTKLMKSSSS